ncbi:hypothetical protein [Streptomyces tremellae]|uniref:hypothetical protein n=1 Tax=Streptomyces tremellae TaxID=1124239 RepID=UPI0031E7CC3B
MISVPACTYDDANLRICTAASARADSIRDDANIADFSHPGEPLSANARAASRRSDRAPTVTDNAGIFACASTIVCDT